MPVYSAGGEGGGPLLLVRDVGYDDGRGAEDLPSILVVGLH